MRQTNRRQRPPGRAGRTSGSTDELNAIFMAMTDAIFVYDAAGRIARMNEAARTLTQVGESQDVVAVSVSERRAIMEMRDVDGRLLPREEWPAVRALHGELLTGAAAPDILARTPDGRDLILNVSSAPLLDAQGQVIGAVCVSRDVTERKRLEQELAEHVAELESAFATQVEGVVYADSAGRIIQMNEAQRQILIARGIDPEDEHIDTWVVTSPPRDAQGQPVPRERLPFYRALRGEILTGEAAVELFQRTRDGRDLVMRTSGAPVRDARGQIVGAVLTMYDVTRQRQLEQQQRDVLRVVAHDLLSPITSMRLYFQTQERRLRQGQPAFVPDEALLNALKANITRMERLVNDLRAATSIEAGALSLDRRPCDLVALCQREVEIQRQLAPERAIQVETPTAPLRAEVDEQRVGQVVANFLSNALKYAPPDAPITLSLRADDATARIEVRDEGPGIPAAEIPRLWERFHRVAGIKAQDGTQSLGLGLYICKAIVEQHGGQVGVESAPGVGSTFWCALPRAALAETPEPTVV